MASDRLRPNDPATGRDQSGAYRAGRRGAAGSDLGNAPAFGGDEEPPRRSRLLPLVIAFFALAAFAGIVWYAYEWGVGQVEPEHLPVVQAPSGPIKEKPSEPGGLEVPYTDSALLNRSSDGRQTPQVERLLPPPEEPGEVPPAPAPEPVPAPAATAPAAAPADSTPADSTPADSLDALPELPRSATAPEVPAADAGPGPDVTAGSDPDAAVGPAAPEAPLAEAPPEAAPATQPSDVQPAEVPSSGVPSSETAVPSAAEEPAAEVPTAEEIAETPVQAPVPPAAELPAEPSAPEPSAPEPSAPEPSAPEPAAEPAPAQAGPELASVPAGSWVVQLAAFRQEAKAREAWQGMQRANGDLLGGMPLLLERADLGERGIYYRIQTGPIPNRATALDLCAQLKAAGQDCIAKQR